MTRKCHITVRFAAQLVTNTNHLQSHDITKVIEVKQAALLHNKTRTNHKTHKTIGATINNESTDSNRHDTS